MSSAHVFLPASALSLDEFEELYSEEKPHYEYWEGEAVQKAMPTLLHFYLQIILVSLLRDLGLAAAGEVRLKLSATKQPIPDVLAGEYLEHPYPTENPLVVIEILSPQDRASRLFTKPKFYAEQNIPYIFVFDPEQRTAFQWDALQSGLRSITELRIDQRPVISVDAIWAALDRDLVSVRFRSLS